MSNDAYWFPHDSDARIDPKMVKLRMKSGVEGIGFFWCTIELLRSQERYSCTLEDLEMLAFDLRCESSVIDSLFDCCLIESIGDGKYHSASLSRRMEKWDEKRKRRADAGRKGGIAKAKRSNAKNKRSNAKAKPEQCSGKIVARREENRIEQNRTEDNITEENNNTPLPPKGAEADFEIFWKQYPKKTGKKKCLDIWKRSKPDLQKCLSTLERQKKSSQWINNNGQYVPNPATWLNQGRWDDEEPEKLYPYEDPNGDGIPF